jgi:MSHA biogenesis protein MshP
MSSVNAVRPTPLRLQQGFAAVAAIFLVVILAALGAFMLTFSNTQQITSVQDLQGSRAYWVARAGLEFGVGTLKASPVCPATNPTKLTLDGFTVCVSCAVTTYTEGDLSPKLFQVTALARAPVLANCSDVGSVGRVGYVERSLTATVEF